MGFGGDFYKKCLDKVPIRLEKDKAMRTKEIPFESDNHYSIQENLQNTCFIKYFGDFLF